MLSGQTFAIFQYDFGLRVFHFREREREREREGGGSIRFRGHSDKCEGPDVAYVWTFTKAVTPPPPPPPPHRPNLKAPPLTHPKRNKNGKRKGNEKKDRNLVTIEFDRDVNEPMEVNSWVLGTWWGYIIRLDSHSIYFLNLFWFWKFILSSLSI